MSVPSRACEQYLMELFVQLEQLISVAVVRAHILQRKIGLQAKTVLLRETLASQRNDLLLNLLPDKPTLLHMRKVDPGYKRPALRNDIQQLLLGKLHESFAYRRSADLQLFGDFLLRYFGARLQIEAHNTVF